MNRHQPGNLLLWPSLTLAGLIIIANGTGLLLQEQMYAKETPGWYAQAIGQDMADLFIVLPFLIITSLLAYRQNKKALLIWGGVLAYLIYTFVIYCFAVHFNRLFVVYCLILGLSVYLFVWFILSQYKKPVRDWFNEKIPGRLIGIYMIVIAVIFYILWLMQIVPANIQDMVPKELAGTGLFTNPVHALDLSVCLPGIMITGILLLRRHPLGLLLTPAVLTFFILMDITIGGLMIVMKWKGLETNPVLAVSMFVLALFSAALLMLLLKSMKRDA
jgi:hypothetical protein